MQADDIKSGPCLRLDSPAPPFTAQTTMGLRSLDDFRGKWLVLFSHPADFTPVCTSEFLAFENRYDDIKALGGELLGLSVDSVYSHLAWLQNIKENFGVAIRFPIIEDVSMAVSHKYGMIHEGSINTATVRSVFFIGPQGILRAVIHYPAQIGRSVDEICRVLAALVQTDARADIVLPEGWEPGSKALRAPQVGAQVGAQVGGHQTGSADPLWYYKEAELSPAQAAL